MHSDLMIRREGERERERERERGRDVIVILRVCVHIYICICLSATSVPLHTNVHKPTCKYVCGLADLWSVSDQREA